MRRADTKQGGTAGFPVPFGIGSPAFFDTLEAYAVHRK